MPAPKMSIWSRSPSSVTPLSINPTNQQSSMNFDQLGISVSPVDKSTKTQTSPSPTSVSGFRFFRKNSFNSTVSSNSISSLDHTVSNNATPPSYTQHPQMNSDQNSNMKPIQPIQSIQQTISSSVSNDTTTLVTPESTYIYSPPRPSFLDDPPPPLIHSSSDAFFTSSETPSTDSNYSFYKSRQSTDSLSDSATCKDGRSRTETHGDESESVHTNFTSEPSSPFYDRKLTRPISFALIDNILECNKSRNEFPTPRFLRPSTFDPSDLPSGNLSSTAEHMVMQLLISQAMMDTKDFEVLSFEKLDQLKQEHAHLRDRIALQTSKLMTEMKVRDATVKILRLHLSYNQRSMEDIAEQLSILDNKVDTIATDLLKLHQKSTEVQQRIVEHFAATLAIGIRQHDPSKSPNEILWQPLANSQLSSPNPQTKSEGVNELSISSSLEYLGSPRSSDGRLIGFEGPHFFAKNLDATNIPPSQPLSQGSFTILNKEIQRLQNDLSDARISIEQKDHEIASLHNQVRKVREASAIVPLAPNSDWTRELARQKKIYEKKIEETLNLAQKEVTATLIRSKREMDEREEEIILLKEGIQCRDQRLSNYNYAIEQWQELAHQREKEINDLQTHIRNLETDFNHKEKESQSIIQNLREDITRAETSLEKSREEITQHSLRSEELSTHLEELKNKHDEDFAIYEREMKSLRDKFSILHLRLEDTLQVLTDREDELGAIKSHIEEMFLPKIEKLIETQKLGSLKDVQIDEQQENFEQEQKFKDSLSLTLPQLKLLDSKLTSLQGHSKFYVEEMQKAQNEIEQNESIWFKARNEWESKMNNLSEEISQIRNELKESHSHNEDLRLCLKQVETHRDELKNKVNELEPFINKLQLSEMECTNLQSRIEELSTEISNIQKEYLENTQKWNEERKKFKEEISEKMNFSNIQQQEKIELQSQLSQALEFFDGLRNRITQTDSSRIPTIQFTS